MIKKEQKIKLKPLGDRILIKESGETKEKKTGAGIIIPITVNEDKGSKKGEVVAVGEGNYEDGKLMPMTVKVGDEVLFQWGDEITVEGVEYHVVGQSNIFSVIK